MCVKYIIDRKSYISILYCIYGIFLVASLLSCSSGGGSSSSGNVSLSSQTSAIAFNLSWKSNAASNVRPSFTEIELCEFATTLIANVYNASDNKVATATWTCTAPPQGEIDNIPTGSAYYNFTFIALDANSNIIWTGQINNVTLTPGTVTDIGTVIMWPVFTLSSINVTPANPVIGQGSLQQFRATATFVDTSAPTQDYTHIASWTSSNEAVATVDLNGRATTVSPGQSTIGAVLGTVAGSTVLTVTNAPSYYIAGQVTLNGSGLQNVTITLTGSFGSLTTQTDLNGHYSFTNATNGSSFTITPTLAGYTFTPANISVTVNNANVTGQNFTAN
jgi:hypothetical protein